MDGWILIGCVFLAFYLYGRITNFLERKRECQIVEELSPDLEQLLQAVKSQDINKMRSDLDELKYQFQSQLAVLRGRTEKPLNICPKCGDTLRVKLTRRYGGIVGCPNYPTCRFFYKISDLDSIKLDDLRVD